MIEYVSRSGPPEAAFCPALVCDHCRQQATIPGAKHGGGARVIWAARFSPHYEASPLYVACCYPCDRQVDARLATRYPLDDGWLLLWESADAAAQLVG